MERFDRFQQVEDALSGLNGETTGLAGVPGVLLRDYLQYCDVRFFLVAYAQRLHLPTEAYAALLRFCYRDTLALRNRMTPFDPYWVTWRYFRQFSYRTGNLDTPDDCEEKLDWERFTAYRTAREKEWRGEALTAQETLRLQAVTDGILAGLRQDGGKACFSGAGTENAK